VLDFQNIKNKDLIVIGEMMVHYYYVDHSKQQSSAQSEASDRGNNQQLPFACSSEILHGNFFLFGQAIWIICQLLGKIYYKF
jgi:hypothetical protein